MYDTGTLSLILSHYFFPSLSVSLVIKAHANKPFLRPPPLSIFLHSSTPPCPHSLQVLERMDVFTKIHDEDKVQTSRGATMALFSWFLVLVLVFSESYEFMVRKMKKNEKRREEKGERQGGKEGSTGRISAPSHHLNA